MDQYNTPYFVMCMLTHRTFFISSWNNESSSVGSRQFYVEALKYEARYK